MRNQFLIKLKESIFSLLPIFLLVILLAITLVPLKAPTLLTFIICSFLLIIGMSLFTLGADQSMIPIGSNIGNYLTKSKNLLFIIITCFLIGTIVTIAEPDLAVLANQIKSIPNVILIIAVAIGVGIFLVISILRIIFKMKLNIILFIFYSLIFILLIFVPNKIISLAFDSGGVTTGPITVPFIMALGIGISSVLGGKNSEDDSFGLVALCSIGPIITVLILGFFFDATITQGETVTMINSYSDILPNILNNLLDSTINVAIALLPILVFFLIFQFFFLKLSLLEISKILISLIYTFIGLVIFLSAVNTGFSAIGEYIGETIAKSSKFLLIPLGLIIGFFVVFSEPAVHVLTEQVENISSGLISKKAMLISLSFGVAISIGLSMLRIILGFNLLYLIIPGYFLAIILSLFVPKIFTAVAFDSGGVASGPMTATFILPLAIGVSSNIQGRIPNDAFGIVAMVALTPLITIQILGLISNRRRIIISEYMKNYQVDDIIYDF